MRNIILVAVCILFEFNVLIAQSSCFTPDESIWLTPWLSCNTADHPIESYGQKHWIQYDFGKARSLSKTWVWNVNDPEKLNTGFNEVAIHYSLDGLAWTHWGDMNFPKGTGEFIYPGFSGPNLYGVSARFIIITGLSNYGDQNCSGFSDIKFNLFNRVDQGYRDIFDGEPIDDIVELCPTIVDIDLEYYPEDQSAYFYWALSDEVSQPLSYAFFFGPVDSDDWEEYVVDEPFIFVEDITDGIEYEYFIEVLCEEDYTSTDVKLFLADTSTSTNDAHVEIDDSGVTILPNPAADYFMLKGDLDRYNINIIDIEGKLVSSVNNVGQEQRIDISSLGVGMYFIKIKHQSNDFIDVQLMIKAE